MAFKIAAIDTFLISIPYDHGADGLALGGQLWTSVEMLLVRVTTVDGIVGWGEGFGFHLSRVTKLALDTLVAPHLLGCDVSTPSGWTDAARRSLQNFGMNGPVMFAVSALDIALWDIAGKQAGKPLNEIIGTRRTSIPAYASLMRYGPVPSLFRKVEAAAEEGFQGIKLHEIGLAEIRSVRDVLGKGQALMVDVNCCWSAQETLAMIDGLADSAIAWIEEPTWAPNDYDIMAGLRNRGIPIAAGENLSGFGDFKNIIAAGAVDIAQPSVTKVGGLTEMLRVKQLCADSGVGLAPHSPYFGPGFLATAHLLATVEETTAIEWFYGDMEADVYQNRFKPVSGMVALPEAPGLGADPDMAVIERYRVS